MPAVPTFDAQGGGITQTQAAMGNAASLMDRAAAARQRDYQFQQQRMLDWLKAPIEEAKSQADLVKAGIELESAKRLQEQRAYAYQMKNLADNEFDSLTFIEDPTERANKAIQWVGRNAALGSVAEFADEMKAKKDIIASMINDAKTVNGLTAEMRTFNALTAEMTPEEKAQAAKVKTGVSAKPSSAAIQYKIVTGPDGAPQLVAVNPRDVGAVALGTGETAGAPFGTPVQGAAPTLKGQTKEQENEAEIKKKRDEARPKRMAALSQAENLADRMTDEIDSLITRVSSTTAGPGGVILEKFPGTSAKDFANDLNSLKANIGFQTLQAMRESSPTGSALGQVSDFENKNLQAALGSLDLGNSPAKLIENLKKVRKNIATSIATSKAGFQTEYGVGEQAPTPESIGSMSDEQLQQRLKQLTGK